MTVASDCFEIVEDCLRAARTSDLEAFETLLTRRSFAKETHAGVPERGDDSIIHDHDTNSIDYTAVPDGWRIVGHLSTGHVTKLTIHCGKCGRVGVLATGISEHLIVHRGQVSYDTLYPIDYCEIAITVH